MGSAREGAPVAASNSQARAPGRRRLARIVASELWDPRLHGRRWLAAMSRTIDAWLRSAAFLELMHQGLKTANVARRFYDRRAPNSPTAPGGGVHPERPDFHSGKRE